MIERILVVEDEAILRRNLVRYLEHEGHEAVGCESAEEALGVAKQAEFAAALVDLRLPGMDGLSLASELFHLAPDTGVIVMTAYSSVDSVVEGLRLGVQDYLIKPVMLKDVAAKVRKLCEHRRLARENARLRRQLVELSRAGQPVARSRAMLDLLSFVRQVATSNATVLVEGPSGSGKEVVARALHEASQRHDGPFLAVNMTAIPENLVESHLFGHERGAFSGAESAREGLFRSAQGGTLFLDEIGDMPLPQQAKLLRAIETKEVFPVGSDRPIHVDCRIVAATNSDLARAVQERRFRGDLYYRLSAIRVRVPPLCERPDDIPALAVHFLERHAKEHRRPVVGFENAALHRLLAYPWPGNVRELSNVVERATVVATGRVITVADLPPEVAGSSGAGDGGYAEAMAAFEGALIASTLERVGGDRREAARLLGLSLATLYRRIEKLGLGPRHPTLEQTG